MSLPFDRSPTAIPHNFLAGSSDFVASFYHNPAESCAIERKLVQKRLGQTAEK
jgi:hypothetical protein